jgi:hypothetical protein
MHQSCCRELLRLTAVIAGCYQIGSFAKRAQP